MAALTTKVRPQNASQLATAYWLTEESVRDIAQRYRCSTVQVRKLAGPADIVGMPRCPVCGGVFVAEGRDAALRLLDLPVYPAYAEQGLVPVCCGPWVSWYLPLEEGDHASGEYGGGTIGERWRNLNGV